MDFFESQERARRTTKWLVIYFALAVVGIIAAVYFLLVAVGIQTGFGEMTGSGKHTYGVLWQPDLLLVTTLGVGVLVAIGSTVKSIQLSAGGGAVARELGGRPVASSTSDPAERRLLNVVEEMALASGVSVPEVYLLEHEQAINAFAAGKSPNDAAIGVTRGCIENLSRDELQGVMAHEFSHILNGDMRLSTRLIGVLHGILMLAIIGRILLRASIYSGESRSSRRESGGALPLLALGLGLLIIGSIGVFFGKLIKAAVSRQREFLADASAVQFTRNPDGIAGALKKIGGIAMQGRLESPRAEEASHMFFANGLPSSISSLLATHPPLDQRIRAIDPYWDGSFPSVKTTRPPIKASPHSEGDTSARNRQGPGRRPGPITPPPLPIPFPLPVWNAQAGASHANVASHLQPANLAGAASGAVIFAEAAALHDQLLAHLDVHEAPNAIALIYALLLSTDPAVLAKQKAAIESSNPPAVLQAIPAAQSAIQTIDTDRKLPFVDLCLPALRQISGPQYESFRHTLEELVAADDKIDLFEFCVKAIIERRLDAFHRGTETTRPTIRSVAQAANDIQTLLSALTHVCGSMSPGATFQAATHRINLQDHPWHLMPAEETSVEAVAAALERLSGATPMIKKNILYACGQLVMEDRTVTRPEMQLLRAIAELLDTPIPPFVTS